MDIVTILIGIVILVFLLIGVPLPYVQIGKKLKKGSKLTYGVMSFVKEKLFVSDDTVEHFTYYIEEFENFVRSNYTPSFTSLYAEIRSKAKLSKMEQKHISDEVERVEGDYYDITLIKKLNRKKIFRQTVRKFLNLVIDISKIGKSIVIVTKEKDLDPHALEENFSNRYNFTSKEFNIYLRHFRSFLDRTHCYHGVEIKHHRLMQLLIPEEIEFPHEIKEKLA